MMKMNDILKLSVMNILRRKLRTALTIIGVIIGTVCIVMMFSVGSSGYEQYKSQVFEGRSFTKITVFSESNSIGINGEGSKLNDLAIKTIRSIKNVKSVTPVINIPCTLKIGQDILHLNLLGVDIREVEGSVSTKYGTAPTDKQSDTNIYIAFESVTGLYTAQEAENESEIKQAIEKIASKLPGKEVSLQLVSGYVAVNGSKSEETKSYRGRVANIFEGDREIMAYTSLDNARKIIKENRTIAAKMNISAKNYGQAIVWAKDAGAVQDVMETIEEMGLSAHSSIEDLDSITSEQKRQQSQLIILGSITLLVSAIGISNTMLTSIWERRSEIGICKVIGMNSGKIRLQFLTESAIIGLLGGILGVAASYITALFMNGITTESTFSKISISPLFSLSAVTFAVLVGILSGLYPAWKSTKLSPLEVMRGG